MINGQLGISNFERNTPPFGFSKFSLNPISIISLNRQKLKKNGIFTTVKASNLIDIEFRPAFDDYLKAMESVKTVREKIPGPVRENNGKDVKLREERNRRWPNGESESETRTNRGLGQRKLEYRENDEKYMGRARTNNHRLRHKFEFENGGSGYESGKQEESIDRINGKWIKGATNKDQRRTYRNPNAEGSDDEDQPQKGNSRDMHKKKPNFTDDRPTFSGREVQKMTDFSGIRKWVPERELSYGSATGSKISESTLDYTLMDWEKSSRSGRGVGFAESANWKTRQTKELRHTNQVDEQVYDVDIRDRNERKSSYRNEGDTGSDRNLFKTEKLDFRSATTHVISDRDHIHTEDKRGKLPLRGEKAARFGRFSKEDIDEDNVDMEMSAFKSFEVFTDVRGQPRVLRMEMEERIQHLAKWLNGTDIDMPQWLFSKMMHSARIRFSDHSILRVIQILGTFGNWRRVLQVIEWLQSRERFKSYKSRFIYTTALDVLGKAKRPVEALNVFHAMREGVSSYPDLAAYHCIAVTLGQAGHTKELFDVIDCMRSPPQKKFNTGYIENWDPRLEPDVVVYNAVLNACVRRKQWEGAFWVLQQLKQQNLQPSSTTYGLVMEVMFVCGKYNLVYEFFRKVEKSHIPNSLNYKVLVNTLWKEGKTDDAVFAVQDMERRGVVGSASLYYDLARCLCGAGRCQDALMQMDKICKVAHKPLVVTYTGLIQACLDAGNVQDGAYIFKEMQEFCSPNLVTCNIMLKAYIEHKMFEDAKNLFQNILDGSCHITKKSDYKNIVNPDIYTFNTMLEVCAAEMKWDDFGHVYQKMLQRGYNFNAKRHLRLILEACRAGKGELLETTWKHLVQANRVPPAPLVKERFCMKLQKNDYADAISMITCYPSDDLKLHAFSEKGWLDLLNSNTNRLQKNTIISLIHKLNNLIAGTDQPHPVIRNLFFSCREFIRSQYVTEINPTEIR